MKDPLNKAERSTLMAKVRSKGNLSTEMAVESVLRASSIWGWRKHPKNVLGHPDFYFPRVKLVVFVDGCFWHGCPKCGRIPKTRVKFWTDKISSNRLRDDRLRGRLRKSGFFTMRIWEHEVKKASWVNRLLIRLKRLSQQVS